MQIGLAIQLTSLHHSRWLLDHLSALGFCSSYSEACKFERNAAVTTNIELDLHPESVVQHVADNADRNTCTLDGYGTFHGMGIIAVITSKSKIVVYPVVPRAEVKKISNLLHL